MEKYFGADTPKLGFGLMRLPKLPDDSKKIDIEQVKVMVDKFMAAGLTYFDTAYVYDDGDSERAAKEALVERYPRESFTLATKLNVWLYKDTTAQSAKAQLATSLERTGAGYFDYYLLHAIMPKNVEKYDEFGIWDFVKDAKAKGLVKHWGFSFHGTPELLRDLLTQHPDAEFVQLQINYADWENPAVTARENYEICREFDKSVVVMEPVKGGTLANPPESVKAVFAAANPDVSLASWAIRYVASLDGILTVLSGMSNVEQMEDNLSYMADFKPLSEAEQETVRKAQEALAAIDSIPCTGCHYCTSGCPMSIPIPEIFSARNNQLIWGKIREGQMAYDQATGGDAGRASECLQCGQCEAACPQHINIIERLQGCASAFEA